MHQATSWLDGLSFGEGPRWHDGRLWFSDFYRHAVFAASLDGDVEEIVRVPAQPSGLGWLPDGRLLLVSMTDRRLLRLEPNGLVEHADLSGIATFHCNDMVVDGAGRAYVGNFGFDYAAARESGGTVTPTAAVLARVDPDGSVHAAAEGMMFPNGSVITPDGDTLIVAETFSSRLTAFTIGADGTLSNRRGWAELPGVAPDGICLDAEGAVWVANARAPECVRVGEGGAILDRVVTSQLCFACALGGADGRTLYLITAPASGASVANRRDGKVERVEVDAPHAGWP